MIYILFKARSNAAGKPRYGMPPDGIMHGFSSEAILGLQGGPRAFTRPSLGSFTWQVSGTETSWLVRQLCLAFPFSLKRGQIGLLCLSTAAEEVLVYPSRSVPACWRAWESASLNQPFSDFHAGSILSCRSLVGSLLMFSYAALRSSKQQLQTQGQQPKVRSMASRWSASGWILISFAMETPMDPCVSMALDVLRGPVDAGLWGASSGRHMDVVGYGLHLDDPEGKLLLPPSCAICLKHSSTPSTSTLLLYLGQRPRGACSCR